MSPPINLWLDSSQEPWTLQWSTTAWGDKMPTGLVLFSFSPRAVDNVFCIFNHEAMLPHCSWGWPSWVVVDDLHECSRRRCSHFTLLSLHIHITSLPSPHLGTQEVLVPFWEKSVGAPSPTWCFAMSNWPYLFAVEIVTTLVWWSWWTRLCLHIMWAMSGSWDCNRLNSHGSMSLRKLNANVTEIPNKKP